jgi:hypothetical protein
MAHSQVCIFGQEITTKRRKTASPHSPGEENAFSQVNRKIVDFIYSIRTIGTVEKLACRKINRCFND